MNQNQMLGFLALAGGGAYLLTQQGEQAMPPAASQSQPLRKAAIAPGALDQLRRWMELNGKLPGGGAVGSGGNGGSLSGLPKEIEDKIKADLKKSWEAASADAKIAVCMRMKAQFPSDSSIQSMNCSNAPNMAFQAVLAAAGAAAGGALCGPPCSVVGILVAAWAGPTLQQWAESAWDSVKDGASDVWDWIF